MPSFDVVCEVDKHEVENAVSQAQREVTTRFDFKDTGAAIERNDEGISIKANSEGRVEAAYKVLEEKFARRKISLKALDPQKAQQAGGTTWRQLVKLKQGIDQDRAKNIVKLLKGVKLKVQAAIQADTVRVSGKKRDDLQEAIAFLKQQDLDLPLTYTNFRD
jgi:uncharacterized protein YajQ (UPF0234 family)